MHLNLKDGKLYYEYLDLQNTNLPTLLIIPGGPGLGFECYKPFFSQLEKHYSLIFFDQRGCGQSQGFEQTQLNIYENIEDIESLRAHLKIKNFHILGISYGAMIAFGYATKYAKNLSGLITIGGAYNYHFIEKAKDNLKKIASEKQINYANKILWPGNFDNEYRIGEFFEVMGSLYSINQTHNNKKPSVTKASIKPLNNAFQTDFWQFDFEKELSKINCPSLLISGQKDWINDPIFAQNAHRLIKNSSFKLYNAGHSIMLDQPEQLLYDLKQFSLTLS